MRSEALFLAWICSFLLVVYGALFVGLADSLRGFSIRGDDASEETERRDVRRIGVGLLVVGSALSAFLALF